VLSIQALGLPLKNVIQRFLSDNHLIQINLKNFKYPADDTLNENKKETHGQKNKPTKQEGNLNSCVSLLMTKQSL